MSTGPYVDGGDELEAMLAHFDLRDGRNPDEPFRLRMGDSMGRGWLGVLKELLQDLIALGWDRRVLQLKENLGSMRLYTAQRTPAILDRVIAAREHSEERCETCGEGGSLRIAAQGWYSTRCDGCWAVEQRPAEGKAAHAVPHEQAHPDLERDRLSATSAMTATQSPRFRWW